MALGVAAQITSATPHGGSHAPSSPTASSFFRSHGQARVCPTRPGIQAGPTTSCLADEPGLEADQGTSLGQSGKAIVEEIPDTRRPVTMVRGTLTRRGCVDPLLQSEHCLRAARHRRFCHLGCNKPRFPDAVALCALPHLRRPAPHAAGTFSPEHLQPPLGGLRCGSCALMKSALRPPGRTGACARARPGRGSQPRRHCSRPWGLLRPRCPGCRPGQLNWALWG